jgi:predicted permease
VFPIASAPHISDCGFYNEQLRWSYGVHLLAQADDEITPDTLESPISPSTPNDDERTPLLGRDSTDPPPKNYSGATLQSEGPTPSVTFADEDEDIPIHVNTIRRQHQGNPDTSVQPPASQGPLSPPRPIRRQTNPQSHFFYSFPNTPRTSRISLPIDSDPEPGPNTGVWEKMKARIHKVNEFLTPPMWAALASLVVACIPPMQHVLEAHLSPVRGALTSAGNCSIPLTLIVLGGYFYPRKDGANLPQIRPRGHGEEPAPREDDCNGPRALERPSSDATLAGTWSRAWKGLKIKVAGTTLETAEIRKGETATVFISVMSRMIITPILLMPACALLAKYAPHDVFDELSSFLYSPKSNLPSSDRPPHSCPGRARGPMFDFTECLCTGPTQWEIVGD